MSEHEALRRAAAHAERYLDGLRERRVAPSEDPPALTEPLPAGGLDPAAVVDELAALADPGIVATSGPRFFGFVIGGTLPAAMAADWLVSAWDQAPSFYVLSPALARIEEQVADWAKDLLGLPAGASVGVVTGAQGANTVGIAAARHRLLAHRGWDVERDGLHGAPPLPVLVGADAHVTVLRSLRLLGHGAGCATVVAADAQGRMLPEALADALAAADGPALVCAQAGDVATGAFDPFEPIAELCAAHGAWLHIDGAFGLWAAASPALRHLTAGVARADSWGIDAHKWLNVPYDAALAIVDDPQAHGAAMGVAAAYLATTGEHRDSAQWVPESSRRGRATPVWAALRQLGRDGVAELVERCCRHARRMAELLDADPAIEVLNDVVLNQVLAGFPGRSDDQVAAGIAAAQADGTCWLGGSRWDGRAVVRVALSNWMTTDEDVERSAAVIRRYLGSG